MSNYPNQIDSDVELPVVYDNLSEIGGDAINAIRSAIFNIENEVGLGGSGSSGSIAARLGVSIFPDGTIKPSAITGLGLVVLPITNSQISGIAGIVETKLVLDHSTQDLYNYIADLNLGVNTATGWISSTGIKLEPHLNGAIYRHILSHIDVSTDPNLYLKNKFELLRNNNNAYTLIDDINNELLNHQFADGSVFDMVENITTHNGSSFPSSYAHTSSGIYLNTDRFSTIPQTAQDLQSFAQFIDDSSIFLYGTRIQNLYSNGISKISRSSSLSIDGYGSSIVSITPVIAYLLNDGTNSGPFDDINKGDDIIEFKPISTSNNVFDEQFSLVRVGDIIRINYGTIEVGFVIKEKKYIQNGGNKKFIIRIAGKNFHYSATAIARIDRPLTNNNKSGVLAIAAANNDFSEIPSLIVGSPTAAAALGNGFKPDQLDSHHYILYLAIYLTGNVEDGYTVLPGIDITGNAGNTPGQYTLNSIIETTNNTLRKAGYNYRFICYSYQGNFGIMLADSYGNVGFSIISGTVDNNGNYDLTATNNNYPNNVISVIANNDGSLIDPLGLGITGSNIASPLYQTSYATPEAAILATKLFLPLRRNNFYVNGAERDKLNLDVDQILDGYGDGYWIASIINQNIFPGPVPSGRVETTYRITSDLSNSNLKAGKTLVVQGTQGGLTDFGRFIIKSINFGCYPNIYTDITVFDAVHATGFSPDTTLNIGSIVALYFNYDSISFNKESATDFTSVSPFKRYFEVYTDLDGKTFSHERARINASSSNLTINGTVPLYGSSELSKLNLVSVSPKLRGYLFGAVNKITLQIDNYDINTGVYSGYLCNYDGIIATKKGHTINGKLGEITRFYDETNIDYIDFIFDINITVLSFTNQVLDIQLFPSLSNDDEIMLIASCQLNDVNNKITLITDNRQFGNTSEKELSTSALNYIAEPEKLLHGNGVIRGLDISIPDNTTGRVELNGGVVLVNGKIININPQTINIPFIKEVSGNLYNINWGLCINDKGEVQNIPLLDFDTTLPTPVNENRLFHAFNILTGSTYILDAVKFSDLIIKRKDLVILYVISSTVLPGPSPTITLTSNDARKYIYNETQLINLTWVPDDIDIAGHFKSINAISTWINKFGSIDNIVKVRGEFDINTLDLTSIKNPLKLVGESAVFNITSPKGFIVKSNISFDNIVFNYNPVGFTTSGNITSEYGCIWGDTINGGFISDVVIKNCEFNSITPNHPPYVSFRVGSNEYVNNIDILDNTFNDTFDNATGIAFVGTYTGGTASQASLISNINVFNNTGLQSQVFYFVNSYSPIIGSYCIPGLTAVNVKVHNNATGYIGLNISGNNNYANISGEQLFSIDNNQLIAVVGPLDETGQNSFNNPLSGGNTNGPGLPTGNVVISNNNLNYIITEGRGGHPETADGYVGYLSIHNNILYANNFSLITNLFGLIPSTVVGNINNIAIYVGGRFYSIVQDNQICVSIINNYMDGKKIGNTYYGYNYGILSQAASLIDENIIRGLVNIQNAGVDIGYGIRLESYILATGFDQTFNKVHHNSIYRNGIGIKSYIYLYDTDADITDNFFDSSYVNVGNNNSKVVFQDISPNNRTIIQRNKNQIITSYMQGDVGVNGFFGGIQMGSGLSGGLDPSVQNIRVIRQSTSNPTIPLTNPNNSAMAITMNTSGGAVSNSSFDWIIPIKELLPKEIKLMSATIVAFNTATCNNTLSIVASKLGAGDTVPTTVSASFSLNNPYNPNTIITISVDLTNYKIGQDDVYNYIRITTAGPSYSGTMNYGPLILKYTW